MKNDETLQKKSIQLDFGHVKNPNKNAVIDKGIQELELELLKADPSGSPVTTTFLQEVVNTLNHRIRNRGFSAHELLFQRDQHTGHQLRFSDHALSAAQKDTRSRNHESSSTSKARGGPPCLHSTFQIGELVYLKSEGDKFTSRDMYIIVSISGKYASLQKLSGTKFSSRKYTVPMSNMFPISQTAKDPTTLPPPPPRSSSDSSEDDDHECYLPHPVPQDNIQADNVSDGSAERSDVDDDSLSGNEVVDDDLPDEGAAANVLPTRHSTRDRRPPPWHDYYTPH